MRERVLARRVRAMANVRSRTAAPPPPPAALPLTRPVDRFATGRRSPARPRRASLVRNAAHLIPSSCCCWRDQREDLGVGPFVRASIQEAHPLAWSIACGGLRVGRTRRGLSTVRGAHGTVEGMDAAARRPTASSSSSMCPRGGERLGASERRAGGGGHRRATQVQGPPCTRCSARLARVRTSSAVGLDLKWVEGRDPLSEGLRSHTRFTFTFGGGGFSAVWEPGTLRPSFVHANVGRTFVDGSPTAAMDDAQKALDAALARRTKIACRSSRCCRRRSAQQPWHSRRSKKGTEEQDGSFERCRRST